MIRFLTDSTCYLPEAILKKYNAKLIPYPIALGDEEYIDIEDIDAPEFLKRVKETKKNPRTAALQQARFEKILKEMDSENTEIVAVLNNQKFTPPSYEALERAKSVLKKAKLYIFNSMNVIVGEGTVLYQMMKKSEEIKSADELIRFGEDVRKRSGGVLVLPDLSFLERGGRIGKARALLGSLFKIIPIAKFIGEEEAITPLGKGKNIEQVNQLIINFIEGEKSKLNGKNIECFIDEVGDNPEALKNLEEKVKEKGWIVHRGRTYAVGIVHTGPRAWYIGYTIIT